MKMAFLCIIPARGGSKGLPGKNIKKLLGKPLICYSIDAARSIVSDEDICVSTDDVQIRKVVEEYGLSIPFIRPESLATDSSSTLSVLKHAIEFYENRGRFYEAIILLQPTSPLRNGNHIRNAIDLYNNELDMVTSVKETKSNPYFVLFEEDESGFLKKSKSSKSTRRQECPKVWELNGAIYIVNVDSLKKCNSFSEFVKVEKYVMDEHLSVDIDNELDWIYLELLLERKIVSLPK